MSELDLCQTIFAVQYSRTDIMLENCMNRNRTCGNIFFKKHLGLHSMQNVCKQCLLYIIPEMAEKQLGLCKKQLCFCKECRNATALHDDSRSD